MKLFYTIGLMLLSSLAAIAQTIGVSPASACAGNQVTLTITGVNYLAASSACGGITTSKSGITSTSPVTLVLTPTQVSAASSTMTMTFNIPANFTPGTYGISMNINCLAIGSCSNCLVVGVQPSLTGNIAGPASACQGDTLTYSVTPATGADSYAWSFPAGWDLTLGAVNTSQVSVATGQQGGDVSVSPLSTLCGTGNALQLATTVDAPIPVPVISQNGNVLSSSNVSATQKWFVDGALIIGATGPSYTAFVSGSYTVVDSNSCGKTTSAPFNYVVNGIEEAGNNPLRIYPNPATGLVQVLHPLNGSVAVEVLDMQGKVLVRNQTYDAQTALNLDGLPAGVYHLKVSNSTAVLKSTVVKK